MTYIPGTPHDPVLEQGAAIIAAFFFREALRIQKGYYR
jgi:hypothetical protein